MKSVLVIGGSGFIGSNVVHSFLKQNKYRVVTYDYGLKYFEQSSFDIKARKHKNELTEGALKVRGNVLNKMHLTRTVQQVNPTMIINLSALPLASVSIENPEEAFGSILTSTLNILEAAKTLNNQCKVIHISSSMVYGDFVKIPNPENSIKDPVEIYGALKYSSELLCRSYMRQYGIPVTIVRPTAVYGPGDENKRVLQNLVEAGLAGNVFTATDPSKIKLDFTYVDDISNGIFLAAEIAKGEGEAYNISAGSNRSIEEAIDIVKNYFPRLEVDIRKNPSFYPVRGTLDISKAQLELGYEPKFNLEKGLDQYIKFYGVNND